MIVQLVQLKNEAASLSAKREKLGTVQGTEVNVVDEKGGHTYAELDVVTHKLFIERKEGLYKNFIKSVINGNKTSYKQAIQDWVVEQIYKKGNRIVRALREGKRTTPTVRGDSIPDIKDIVILPKHLIFAIEGNEETFKSAVEDQLKKLREENPGWTFEAIHQ